MQIKAYCVMCYICCMTYVSILESLLLPPPFSNYRLLSILRIANIIIIYINYSIIYILIYNIRINLFILIGTIFLLVLLRSPQCIKALGIESIFNEKKNSCPLET